MPDVDREQQFLEAEHLVELHSVELKKELRLADLVLTQILYIVGLAWIGYAAKLGPANVVFWLAAVILFYIPSGIVIIHLSREMPLEGGIYQWAKLRFGDFVHRHAHNLRTDPWQRRSRQPGGYTVDEQFCGDSLCPVVRIDVFDSVGGPWGKGPLECPNCRRFRIVDDATVRCPFYFPGHQRRQPAWIHA
jgi:hypothetical protein